MGDADGLSEPRAAPCPTSDDVLNRFREFVGTVRTPGETLALELNRVVTAKLSRTVTSALSVRHLNGRVSIYTRTPDVLKSGVAKSQRNKRLTLGGPRTSDARRRVKTAAPRPTATEQVGLLASIGLSDLKLN